MSRKILKGEKFGNLTVVELDFERNELTKKRKKNGEIKGITTYYICQCECGKIKSVPRGPLLNGRTVSCGCLKAKRIGERSLKQNEYEEYENFYKGWDTKHENYFYISKQDYGLSRQYCWYKHHSGYFYCVKRGSKNKGVRLHQLICEQIYGKHYKQTGLIPDHLNRKKYDNRRENLELKTYEENAKNLSTRSDNTSGKSGVGFNKRLNKWSARIFNNKKEVHLGYYETFDEAVLARIEAEKKYGYIGE